MESEMSHAERAIRVHHPSKNKAPPFPESQNKRKFQWELHPEPTTTTIRRTHARPCGRTHNLDWVFPFHRELDFCLHYLSTLLGSIIIVDHYHHARCSIAQVREPGWSMRSVSLPHHSRGACEPACLPACLLDDMSTPNHLFVMLYVHLFLRFLDKHHTSEPLSFYYL